MRSVCLAVLLCGCAVHHVETYPIEGKSAAELDQAARRAAEKLGWQIDANARGRLRLVDVPWEGTAPTSLEVFTEDGALIMEGDRPQNNYLPSPLSPAAPVLATMTARELSVEKTTPVAPAVTRRSRLAAAALDVVLPAAGALYAGLGDPFLTNGAGSWATNPWAQFGFRLGVDVTSALCGAVLLLEPVNRSNWGLWLAYGEMVVLNRIMALVFDLRSIGFRNAYADGGLPPPEQPLPLPGLASR